MKQKNREKIKIENKKREKMKRGRKGGKTSP